MLLISLGYVTSTATIVVGVIGEALRRGEYRFEISRVTMLRNVKWVYTEMIA